MPPSRPFSGRVRTSSSLPRVTTKAAPRRSVAALLRRLARKRLLVAAQARGAFIVQRAERAGRLFRRADRGAEVHQGLRAVAGARLLVAGAGIGEQRRRQLLDQRFCLRQRFLDGEQPRHHALDIAVDRHGTAVECDRRDRRRRIGTDPGERAQAFFGVGKEPVMVAQHRDRAGVQIARPRIIAESGPHPQHVVERSASERRDIRPARNEFFEIGPNGLHAGLLQHDFRQPHPVRISPLPRRRPPRQPAAMPAVPGKQQRGTAGASAGAQRFVLLDGSQRGHASF